MLHFDFVPPGQDVACLDRCIDILRSAPNINSLGASFSTDLPALQQTRDGIIVSSDLQNLRLMCYELSSIRFNAWKLPKLKRLRLWCFFGSDVFVDFFKLSTPPLTLLSISYMARPENLAEIVSLVPTLQALELMYMELDVALLRSLTMTDGTASNNSLLNAGGSCPNLESLEVTVCSFVGDRDACLDCLITMLKSRAKIMASFKTICCNESMDKYDANDIHKQLLGSSDICLVVGDVSKY